MTDGHEQDLERQSAVEDRAIEWFVRMRGEDAPKLAAEFEAWMRASPAHAAAYQWAEMHFGASGAVKASRRLTAWRRTHVVRATFIAAAAAVALAAALSVWPLWKSTGPSSPSGAEQSGKRLATLHGEIRTYNLPDGSRVTLDSDSRIELAMGKTERRITLHAGTARFSVSRDTRPFVVEAGPGTVWSKQAIFDVGYGRQRDVEVRLISGSAAMTATVRPAVYMIPPRPLQAGRTMRYPLARYTPSPAPADSIDRSAWPSGWVEYRTVALADLIGEANRYADKPIVLDDAGLGAMTAAGRFKLTDTDTFVSRLGEVFDLSVSREPDGIHLRHS